MSITISDRKQEICIFEIQLSLFLVQIGSVGLIVLSEFHHKRLFQQMLILYIIIFDPLSPMNEVGFA
jgi:hypothetical protein